MARFSRRGRLGALALAAFCGSMCFVPAPGRAGPRNEAEAWDIMGHGTWDAMGIHGVPCQAVAGGISSRGPGSFDAKRGLGEGWPVGPTRRQSFEPLTSSHKTRTFLILGADRKDALSDASLFSKWKLSLREAFGFEFTILFFERFHKKWILSVQFTTIILQKCILAEIINQFIMHESCRTIEYRLGIDSNFQTSWALANFRKKSSLDFLVAIS